MSKLYDARCGATRLAAGSMIAGAAMLNAVLLSAGPAAAAAPFGGSFSGGSYGAEANMLAGPVATSLGRSAHQSVPCRGTDGKVLSTSVDSLEAGSENHVLRAGATRGSALTATGPNSAVVHNIATISDLNMLDGLITAGFIRGVTSVRATRASMQSFIDGSSFVNLKVAGVPVSADVAPGTKVALPGVGTVTFKDVKRFGDMDKSGAIKLNMLTVDVKQQNRFGLNVGAQLIVANSISMFSRQTVDLVLSGVAYGTSLEFSTNQDVQNEIGKAAALGLGCEGTHGMVQERVTTATQAGGILSVGTARSTRQGGPTAEGALAKMTSTVDNVRLFNGLVQAAQVRAVAQSEQNGAVRTNFADGSGISALKIAGVPIGDVTGANRRITVPGIGYAILNEQIFPQPRTHQRLRVNGLRVVVTQQNRFGIEAGADLAIGHAESTVFK